MSYNRRYRNKATASRSSHPFVSGSVAALTCLVAAVCGWQLDSSSKAAPHAVIWDGQDARASLRPEPSGPSLHSQLITRIERSSGIVGPGVFGAGWTPLEPVIREGLELSSYLSLPFLLERSQDPSFRIDRVIISPRFSRDDAFLEFILGSEGEPQSSVLVRPSEVSVFYLSPGGLRKILASKSDLHCDVYEVVVGSGNVSLQCAGSASPALTTAITEPKQHRIALSTNLTRSELESMRIVGHTGEAPFEEVL